MTGSARSSSDAIPVFPCFQFVSLPWHNHKETVIISHWLLWGHIGQGEPRNPIKSIPPSFRQCHQYSSQKGLVDPVSQLCGVIPLSWDPRCVQTSDTIFTLLIFFYNPYQVTFIAAYILFFPPCFQQNTLSGKANSKALLYLMFMLTLPGPLGTILRKAMSEKFPYSYLLISLSFCQAHSVIRSSYWQSVQCSVLPHLSYCSSYVPLTLHILL